MEKHTHKNYKLCVFINITWKHAKQKTDITREMDKSPERDIAI